MSLKELTQDNHQRAEETPFMKAIFTGTLPIDAWADFTFQKSYIYTVIENIARSNSLLEDLEGIERARLLLEDANEMNGHTPPKLKTATIEYVHYLVGLNNYPERILAHLYVWHMGDLFGGQMIKRAIQAPHRALDFENADLLKAIIRAKLNDTMADEANVAFNWAIKLLEEYTI